MKKLLMITIITIFIMSLASCSANKEIQEDDGYITDEEIIEEDEEDILLTIYSDENFNNMMTNTLSIEEQKDYFESISGSVVEFDGAIDYLGFVPEKKTRVTFVLRQGDYDPDRLTGPLFIIHDIGATDESVIEAIQAGATTSTNVRIRAEIKGFEDAREAVIIKPIKISIR